MAEPPAEDPLAALRAHVRHAHAAAERLAFDAGATRARPSGAPVSRPRGAGTRPPGGPPPGSDQPPGAGAPAGPAMPPGANVPPGSVPPGSGDPPGPGMPGPETPPSGWAANDPAREIGGELRALVELVESLQGLLPAELRDQLHEVIRQILLLARAVIDWLVERMQSEPPEPPAEVQDIPIR